MPNTDYTGYRVVFIIWKNNAYAICSTMLSFNIHFWSELLYSKCCIHTLSTYQTLITLITVSFLSSRQITLTLSVQRRYLSTYSYNIALLYSLCCIHTLSTYRTLITLITESLLSSGQITLTLSVQRWYLSTYTYESELLYSKGCIHALSTCQTPITLITESLLSSRQIMLTARWLTLTGIHRFRLAVGAVYPKKYAHGFCFAVLCCGYTLTDFPISNRLTSLALWQSNDCPNASKATLMNMDKYFM